MSVSTSASSPPQQAPIAASRKRPFVSAVLERADPRDALVVKKGLVEEKGWRKLEDLEEGCVVGTSSVRRVAQLKRAFPKLVFMDVVSFLGWL